MTEKRKRSPNWLLSEKHLLMELVEKHLSIIENKKTDTATMRRKLTEWEYISHEYNSRTEHCLRSGENLKCQWDNLKKNARREESNFRMQGGPNPKKDDPVHSRIMTLIELSAGLCNPIDTNCVSDNEPELHGIEFIKTENDTNESRVDSNGEDESNEEVNSIELVVTRDWSNPTPEMLKAPNSKPLQVNNEQEGKIKNTWFSRRRPIYTSSLPLQKLHKKKIEAIDLQKCVAQKEILHKNEAHELDLEIKREQLKQEKIKTRMLLLDLKFKKRQLTASFSNANNLQN